MTRVDLRLLTMMCPLLAIAAPAVGQTVWPELEANDTPATANLLNPMLPGDSVSGQTLGASTTGTGAGNSADYFRITTQAPPQAASIARYRLALTPGPTTVAMTIRGVTQLNGLIGTSETAVQTSADVGGVRYVQWYGLGPEARTLLVRMTGQVGAPAYMATLTADPVQVTDLGVFPSGPLTVTMTPAAPLVDGEVWVYTAAGVAVPGAGNDDAPAPLVTTTPRLNRTLPDGVYLLAVSDANLFNDQASPPDDSRRNRSVVNTAGILGSSSAATGVNLGFVISTPGRTLNVAAVKTEAFGVLLYRFTIGVPGGCSPADVCGIGGPPTPADGAITGDDFVAFINAFGAGGGLADITGIGGPPTPADGAVTGDDFVAFINAFADGCP
ncbi:MAG: hypothetical protein LW650_04460 [Planctomycetaceae bacterium]|nr:hypothetical protein [Planctomycetaceae bacterium]